MTRGRKIKSEELKGKKQVLLEEISKLETAISEFENELSVSSYENWKSGREFSAEHPKFQEHRVKRERLQDFLTKIDSEISVSLSKERDTQVASLDTDIARIEGLRHAVYKKYQTKKTEIAELQKKSQDFGEELQLAKGKRDELLQDTKTYIVKLANVDTWLNDHYCTNGKELRERCASDVKRNNIIIRERRTNVDVVLGYDVDYFVLTGKLANIQARLRRVE